LTKIVFMSFLSRRKLVYLLFALTFNITFVHSQKLTHVLGEFIVQVDQNRDLEKARKNLVSVEKRFGNFKSKQLMSAPLNLWLVSVDYASVNELSFEKALKSSQIFKHVSKNRLITPRAIPNDPDFSKQWQFINSGSNGGVAGADMDMDLAWDITTGGLTADGDTIVVCIIDDGINADHLDMKDNLWKNIHEIPNNGIDDDGNGYIDDYRGWDVTTDNDDVYQGGGHGTPVAGIVGAKGNNNIGVSGVNWDVKLMIVNNGSSTEANAIAAYAYPYQLRKMYNETNGEKGAFVVATNASWGIDNALAETAPLWCAIYDSLGYTGIISCGATTNSDTDVDVEGDLPTSCASDFLISVTNLTRSDVKFNAAGYGRRTIDIGSYGHQAYTVTRTAYGGFGGTSGATPHVTGVIALLYSAPCQTFIDLVKSHPDQAALVAKDMVLHGNTPNNSLKNITTTGGKLNAFRALSNIMDLCEGCSVPAGITYTPTDSGIIINWASESGTSLVRVRYRKVDDSNWTIIQNINKNDQISGLDVCSEYEIQLGSDCGFIADQYSYSSFIFTEGCCGKPLDILSVEGENSIALSWEYTPQTEYTLEITDQNSAVATYVIDTNYFVLSDLPTCEAFTLRIQTFCKKYENSSEYTDAIDITTSCGSCTSNEYCGFGPKDATQEWIAQFKLGDIDNRSVASPTGYRSFAGGPTTTLYPDQVYDFEIVAGYASNVFPDYYKVYIDWNQNGVWDAEDEVFVTDESIRNGVTGSFSVPSDFVEGTTLMRVIMSYESFDGACDNVEYEYGEVEDYCISIFNNYCNESAEVMISSIENTKVNFNISSLNEVSDSILVSFRKKGESTWESSWGADSIVLSGLSECTLYEYQYSIMCDDIVSATSQIDTFKTACKNQIQNIDETQIKVYPNPTSNILTLEMNVDLIDIKKIRLLHVSGISHSPAVKYSNDAKVEMSLSNLLPGVYLLEIVGRNGVRYVRKVVKMGI
jgi:serine protease